MTFEEKIATFKKENVTIGYNSYHFFNFGYKWGQADNNTSAPEYRSFFGLQQAISRGATQWIEENLEGYKEQLSLLKQAYHLFQGYKGNKKVNSTYNSDPPISFNRGVLVMSNLITPTNLLTWSRLVEHALVRAAKHPRNK